MSPPTGWRQQPTSWAPLEMLSALSPKVAKGAEGSLPAASLVPGDAELLLQLGQACAAQPAHGPIRAASNPQLRPRSALGSRAVLGLTPLGGAPATPPARQRQPASGKARDKAREVQKHGAPGVHEFTKWAYSSPCLTSAKSKWAPQRRPPTPQTLRPPSGNAERALPEPTRLFPGPAAPVKRAQRPASSPLLSRRSSTGQWAENALRPEAFQREKAFELSDSLYPTSAARSKMSMPHIEVDQAREAALGWRSAASGRSQSTCEGEEAQPDGEQALTPPAGGEPTRMGPSERAMPPESLLRVPLADIKDKIPSKDRRRRSDPSKEAPTPSSSKRRSSVPDFGATSRKDSHTPRASPSASKRRSSINVPDGGAPHAEQHISPPMSSRSVASIRHTPRSTSARMPPRVRVSSPEQTQEVSPGEPTPSPSDFQKVVKPKNMTHPPETLRNVFQRFKKDGEVHIDALGSALSFLGIHPVIEWIKDCCSKVTRYTTLDMTEFFLFVGEYEERRKEEQLKAFHAADADGSGAIDMDEMSDLLDSLGLKPMDFVIKQIFDEVDEDGSGEVDLHEFGEVWTIIETREGFSKPEYDRLVSAFSTFDADGSGTLDRDEALKTLHYLHYQLTEKEVLDIWKQVDLTNLGHLSQREFILFMRKVRELEVAKIEDSLERVTDSTKEGALVKLLVSLGHTPDRTAVLQAAADAGIAIAQTALQVPTKNNRKQRNSFSFRSQGAIDQEDDADSFGNFTPSSHLDAGSPDGGFPRSHSPSTSLGARTSKNIRRAIVCRAGPAQSSAEQNEEEELDDSKSETSRTVTIGQAWKFLESFRTREGLMMEELRENRAAFAHVLGVEYHEIDPDDSDVEITHHQTWQALRYLGWRVPKEAQMQLVTQVDLDLSGLLSLFEFNKLVRLLHESELQELHRHRVALGLHMKDLFDLVHTGVAKRLLIKMGFSIEDADPKDSLARFGATSIVDHVDWYNLIRLAKILRRREREQRKLQEGFTNEEVEKLQVVFDQCSDKRVVTDQNNKRSTESTGTLRHDIFLRLLEEDYAPVLFLGIDVRDLHTRICASMKQTVDWKGLLKIVAGATRDADERYHTKLEKAQEICNFSPEEVKEFRAIFASRDKQQADFLSFEVVVEMLNRLTPMKARYVSDLFQVWEETVKAFDLAMPLGATTRLPDKLRTTYSRMVAREPGATDFPEFLCLIKRLLDIDFCAIKSITANMVEDVRTPSGSGQEG